MMRNTSINCGYDALGRRSGIGRASSTTEYGYDGISRLTSLTQRFAGNAGNATHSLSYNPASQITQATRDNDAFAFTGLYNVNRSYTVNGPIYLIRVANYFGIWTLRTSQLEAEPD